jgi:NAD(P)-dependent dehydrogenase (short-subunit alcohol dehydrogenase family)
MRCPPLQNDIKVVEFHPELLAIQARRYTASKFAVDGWMECLRLELERFGITAILIEPGFFRTDFLDNRSVSYGDIQIEKYAAWSAETRARQDH